MKRLQHKGFTIIEVILFLGVTGLLMTGILVGTGTAINNQRYRDSVVSLQTEIQSIYSDVQNTRNERTSNIDGCPNVGGGNPNHRGQSQCLIIGVYFTISGSGELKKTAVYSEKEAVGSSDFDALRNSRPRLLLSSTETSRMEWGTRIAWPTSGSGARNPTTPRSIVIFILRSPISGTVYTFTHNGQDISLNTPSPKTLQNMIQEPRTGEAYGRTPRTLCVEPNGLVVAERMAVLIEPRSATSNAIETASNTLLKSRMTNQC